MAYAFRDGGGEEQKAGEWREDDKGGQREGAGGTERTERKEAASGLHLRHSGIDGDACTDAVLQWCMNLKTWGIMLFLLG